MRIVLDTNILIALALGGDFTEELFEVITTAPNITSVTSHDLLLELKLKLQEKFNWLQEDIELFISRIKETTHVVKVIESISVVKRDPKDNMVLECAIAGNVDLIVTIDQDLIKLKNFRGIAIIHPKTFTWTFPEHFKKN